MNLRSRARFLAPYAAVAVLAAGAGWFGRAITADDASYRGTVLREDNTGYSLIDPILACDIGTPEAFPELNPVKDSLTSLISQRQSDGSADHVSVYVRLLKSGKWFELNGDTTYAPASLLKVFIMMAYYKESEDKPDVLRKTVSYEGSANPVLDDPGEVIPHLVNGKLYTIDDAIRQMIIYSDNDALNTLVDNFDPDTLAAFNEIFTDLNIPSPSQVNENTFNYLTVSQYSMFFKVLYNATYLSRDDSEKALNLLAHAAYNYGIAAGVPGAITVAHKFGVTTEPATATSPAHNELHDCGIIYYPNHPYLLCVMTSGENFATLQKTLADVSQTAYKAIDAYYASRPALSTTTPSILKQVR